MMGRRATCRKVTVVAAGCLICLLPVALAPGQASDPSLKLLISSPSPYVAEPDAARIVLHVHNASDQTVWLYRRARGKFPPAQAPHEENRPIETIGGCWVEVVLQPADAQTAQSVTQPAKTDILEYVQMPKPRLVKLAAGGDYEETSIVHWQPALAGADKPVWGAYRLTVTYGASYSNADQFQRVVGSSLWQGEVQSNTIPLELRPPLPDVGGTIEGTAVGPDAKPREGIRVSLQEEQGQLIDQQITGLDGRYSFDHLPPALYWVTGRWDVATRDTMVFRHAELSHEAPTATTQLVLYPPDNPDQSSLYDPRLSPAAAPMPVSSDPKKMVHKPVLARVFDPAGHPLAGISIDAVFTNGDVIDEVKAVTADDGSVPMELIPGRSAISLKKHGCADEPERADVAPGRGVDAFKFVFECTKR